MKNHSELRRNTKSRHEHEESGGTRHTKFVMHNEYQDMYRFPKIMLTAKRKD